jgi:hypothetical protein
MKRMLLAAVFMAAAFGCQTAKPPAQPPAPVASAAPTPHINPAVVQVYLLQLAVPFGTVSKNDKFWKLVNEDVVDPSTAAMLSKNGLRVGRAQVADWSRFRDILDRDAAYSRTCSITGVSGIGVSPLDMTGRLDRQRIFALLADGWAGRSYGLSQNLFDFSFAWVPQQPYVLRVSVCPVVMTLRQRMDYTLTDDPVAEPAEIPERYYDLGLRAEIPPNQFLVIGPSPTVAEPDTIGSNFLMQNRPSDRLEQLIIVVGKMVDLTKTRQSGYPVAQGSPTESTVNR